MLDSVYTFLGPCKNNLNNFVILHMGLKSLKSDFKCVSFDANIISIACWEHIEQENLMTYFGN